MFASKDVFLKSSGGGYSIARSVRLRNSASAYLNRTFSTPTNNKIFTYSAWVKIGSGTTGYPALLCCPSTTDELIFNLTGSNGTIEYYNNAAISSNIKTNAIYRDPSGWYHIMVATDTTQTTASNRVKLYVNGVQVTSFNTATYPAQNYSQGFNSAASHQIGKATGLHYFDGYLTEINFIDGQQLTPSSFGAISSTTGVWQPIAYTGTYGTNGFYLKFANNSTAAALGTDSSGNSNTWTVNNISVTAGVTYDSMLDVPTLTSATVANYAVLNPLAANSAVTAAQGNLSYTASNDRIIKSTISATSGKWYWEFAPGGGGGPTGCGAINPSVNIYAVVNLTLATAGVSYLGNGNKSVNGTVTSYGATYTSGDLIGVALDLNANTITFYKNNASQGSISITSGLEWCPAFDQTTGTNYVNFGQRPFTYTPPSGFVALNTYNLSTPTIPNGAVYMAATTYTGTGAVQSITNTVNGTALQPDWIWIKRRSAAENHWLVDVIRGVTEGLSSNLTGATVTRTDQTTAFNSNGFALGVDVAGYTNISGQTYVAWQWKANGTGVSNTDGSITSTVSANTTAGFAVVTYTGTGANATVGHGLGVAPSMIIVKARNLPNSIDRPWAVYHSGLTSAAYVIFLNTTAAQASAPTYWNSTAPTSTVFSLGNEPVVNGATGTVGQYVAYVFAAVAGYSAMGSYTGNGSTDGPFVFLGFRPRFVIIKRTDTTNNWHSYTSTIDPYNVVAKTLYPSLSNAEATENDLDFVSNGMKMRDSGTHTNASGGTYIYMCFAENPFKYSLAR
jgi:hypothetical protein